MGLLTPGLLLLGLGIAIPLYLHLFQRHQGPRVTFPALRYLRRAERESARRIKLRQIILMLLRIAIVLLIAFAAARPFMRAGGVRHEPTAVVLILDNSMSSGAVIKDARLIDALKDRALATLAAAEPEDRFWLLRAGSSDEPAYPGDAIETARRVRETEPSDGAADIAASIVRARGILAAGAGGRAAEIQLLSDLQASNFSSIVRGGDKDPALVVWRSGDDAPANRAISSISVGGGIAPSANERATIAVALDGNASDSVNVRLLVDGRLAAATRAGAGGAAVVTLPARPSGIVSGWVEMDADALRADNRRYFAARVSAPPTVAVSRPVAFVDEALSALEAAGRIRRATPGTAEVVLLPGAGSGAEMGAGRTSVILPPESPLEVEAVNRRLSLAGIPWSYALQDAPGEARFAMRDSADAVLQTLENARLRNVYVLRAGNGARGDSALLRLRDGSPWAVRGERPAGGRYILLATPLSESASSIPTSAAMVPLLDRIVRTWAADASGTEEATPGATIALPARADSVVRPDSVTELVTGGAYQVPSLAGIYQVKTGSNVIGAFAVNPPALESDLARIRSSQIKTLLPGWDIESADRADEWRDDVYRARVGRELWRALLIAMLCVLVVESAVAFAGGLRRASTAAASQESA